MQTSVVSVASVALVAPSDSRDAVLPDLGPMAWVLDELQKSLDGATKALRRFVRDAELARGSDIAALDTSHLRIARQQLHQAVGALEMVGLEIPAKMLRAMEALTQKFVQSPQSCSDIAAQKLERASFALIDYLFGLLKGRQTSSVALFPQYRSVLELLGSDRIHPADLWACNWHWADVPVPTSVAPLSYNDTVRTHIDTYVLNVVKTGHVPSAHAMHDISLGFAAAQTGLHERVFWCLAAAYFEAVATNRCPSDNYTKRAASQILAQYRSLAKGGSDVSERLLQDLLFFCSRATPDPTQADGTLVAVRAAYGLTTPSNARATDYETPQYGRFDPALLVQARKRIAALTETWSALSGGDTNRIKACADQFSLVADSITKLHPDGAELAASLSRSIDSIVQTGQAPSPALAMEVATAALYLEAAYDDMDSSDETLLVRCHHLALRLDRVIAGGQPEPLDTWMEELYRRVSDRQTMGSVVGELRTALGEVETALDAFFRQPDTPSSLHAVPGKLAQMRGVFSVLGLDQAALATLRMRNHVEQFWVDAPYAKADQFGVFEKLGNSLGALGFLVDMLGYQRELAKKLFVYDEDLGEFKFLTGRQKTPLVAPPAPPAFVLDFPDPPSGAAEVPSAAAVLSFVPPPPPDDEDDNQELREIFLEEATEVIQNGLLAISALAADPSDTDQQMTLRRAFHTLKGSSRMVGLTEFGEAAWSFEQLLNAWLPQQKPVSSDMLQLTQKAMDGFGRWVADIAANTDQRWAALPFRRAADSLRLDNAPMGLLLPEDTPPDIAPPPSDVSEAATPPQAPVVAVSDTMPTTGAMEDGDEDAQATVPGDLFFASVPSVLPVPIVTELLDFSQPGFMWPDLALPPPPESSPESPPTPTPATDQPMDQVDQVDQMAQVDQVDRETQEDQSSSQAQPQPVTTDEVDLSDLPLDFVLPDARDVSEQQSDSISSADATDADATDATVATSLTDAVEITDPSDADTTTSEDLDLNLDFAPDSRFAPDDKVIGTLRIGLALYNVYLNEAEEWSQRLLGELVLLSMQPRRPLSDAPVTWAHSLAGSSATVGFMELSGLARALEHALLHVQSRELGLSEHLPVFVQAAQNARHLLQQFAIGILESPEPALLSALRDILDIEPATAFAVDLDMTLAYDPVSHAGTGTEADADADADTHFADADNALPVIDLDIGFDLLWPDPAPSPVPAAVPDEPPDAPSDALPLVPPPAPVAVTPTMLANLAPVQPAPPLDSDELDAFDVLDIDLFPIFDEEAQELMPRLSAALRQWLAYPGDVTARHDVLRVLHTLKGSARLAGAMRLGEMAHHLESAALQIAADTATAPQIDPLLTRLDHLQSHLDTLRLMPIQSMVLPEAEPRLPETVDVLPASEQTELDPTTTPPDAATAAPVPELPTLPTSKASAAASRIPSTAPTVGTRRALSPTLRIRSNLLDRMVNQAGEVIITRTRLESRLGQLQGSLGDLSSSLDRLRTQLRDLELQSESQMQSRLAQTKDLAKSFDPLEFDRFTRVQELTRMMAESVHDVATLHRTLQQTTAGVEDDLIAQARQTRELQHDLLRTRMVEFESIAERLYGVVRQAAKDTGRQVKLDIMGGALEMDRSVLERMAPSFEHLLRNAVAHGIEDAPTRAAAGKPATGSISIILTHQGNDVSVSLSDDGAGLNLDLIRAKAIALGHIAPDQDLSDDQIGDLIFTPGFSTAARVSELAGRGVGTDVVRTEVHALGGRIELNTLRGQGTRFNLVLPLTTAVTQVVLLRIGDLVLGVPTNLVELVKRVPRAGLDTAYQSGHFMHDGHSLAFYWAGALLQMSSTSTDSATRSASVVICRSAGQQVAMHVDEVLGNREAVVKNLGPQLSRLPGLAGVTVLASGAVVLIYNPVALSTIYGDKARSFGRSLPVDSSVDALAQPPTHAAASFDPAHEVSADQPPLILVVDDSITVRRVTQRLLKREGYRVALANDGLHALEVLQNEKPAVVLSDIEMPRMDGFDLVRNLRHNPYWADLPIIMITSRIAQKHRDYARELQVDHYLGKPYPEDQLLELLRQYCADTTGTTADSAD